MMINPNNNFAALITQNNTSRAQNAQEASLQKLSSGARINSAKDDAAGAAIIQQFAAQIAGSNQAVRNLSDGISLAQTTEGALSSIAENTERLRELTVAAGNSALSASDRQALQAEADALSQSNDDIVRNTQFNGQAVLQGGQFNFQAGANAGDQLSLSNAQLGGTSGLNSVAGRVDLSSPAAATASLQALDADIDMISGQRANLGAFQSRLENGVQNLQTTAINTSAAKSRVADTDYAAETARLAQENIRTNAGLAMQVQARANAGQVLSLLR
ncbi:MULTISPECIES: flagellin N-terminal helical domain-containing protein [Deefgea]|uniref:Flagellin n=1 Tax=Deefgea chitinilytica TaxID=570276 RepID=A0ABS2CD52_9NEIS|nr:MULTISPECIES: flagellin [Deefgea]MBM5571388.1 flagellin FliC [Deefgea chitinilytica]MBM9888621.1 flagellin FliC [Deefgea sp. CFH1-16]